MKRILAFKIGRGGRFHNQGHKTFIGEYPIGKYTDDLFIRWTKQVDFKERYGFDYCIDRQKCILDLIYEEDFEQLEEKFGITEDMLGERKYYCGASGESVGLTKTECDSGVGCIDIDGEYNTIYTKYLEDCSEEEIELVRNSGDWNTSNIVDEWELL